MSDNSIYPLGYDLYQGNDVNPGGWALMRPAASFLYLRASIGWNGDDKFSEFHGFASAAGFLLGAFAEQWPGVGASAHLRIANQTIGSRKMDLPFAVAYEPEPIKDKHRGWVMTWPEAGTTDSIIKAFPDRTAMIYTNQDGLNHLKAAGLDLSKYYYWYASYFQHKADGERPVATILNFLQATYGIPASRILFMQTSKQGDYPKGVSPDLDADIDRAVAYIIGKENPPPTTTTTPAGFLTVLHEDNTKENLDYFTPNPIREIQDSVTGTLYEPPVPVPPTVPPIVVSPTLNIYMVKHMYERAGAPTNPFNKPDVEDGGKDSVVPLTDRLQWFWYSLLFRNAPVAFNEEDVKRAWRNLTASNRAFTNKKGTDVYRDYISGRNIGEEDAGLDKWRVCGWNPVNVLDEEHPVRIAGELYYTVQAFDPDVKDLSPDHYNRIKTPHLIHLANICYSRANVGPFPQLDGEDVPYPIFGVGGVNFLRVDWLVKWEGDIPNPYIRS